MHFFLCTSSNFPSHFLKRLTPVHLTGFLYTLLHYLFTLQTFTLKLHSYFIVPQWRFLISPPSSVRSHPSSPTWQRGSSVSPLPVFDLSPVALTLGVARRGKALKWLRKEECPVSSITCTSSTNSAAREAIGQNVGGRKHGREASDVTFIHCKSAARAEECSPPSADPIST